VCIQAFPDLSRLALLQICSLPAPFSGSRKVCQDGTIHAAEIAAHV